ncbi:MAG: hypothetical protein V7K88_12430 [Nostoc sp.]|uniref:hypothetical protein n=1 Tax=Nostoc sp. TaxID=1180 RepID=UPI002FFC19A2
MATGLFVQFNNSKVYQDIIITIVACLVFIPPSLYLYRDYYNALTLLYNCIFLAIIMSIIFTIYLSVCILISEKTSFKKADEQAALIKITMEGRVMNYPDRYTQEKLLALHKAKMYLEMAIWLLSQ